MVVPAHAYEVTGGDEGKGEDGLAPPAAAAVRHGARCRWSSRLPCRGGHLDGLIHPRIKIRLLAPSY